MFVRELRRLGGERKTGELSSRWRAADSRFKYQRIRSKKKDTAKSASEDEITIEETAFSGVNFGEIRGTKT